MIRKKIRIGYIHTNEIAFGNINASHTESDNNKHSANKLYTVSFIFGAIHLDKNFMHR